MEFIRPPEERRVPPDYHITWDKVKYSVPYTLVNKIVMVRSSSKNIEIRFDGQIVAMHLRSYKETERITVDVHIPENHKTFNTMSFNDWLSNLDVETQIVVKSELKRDEIHGHKHRLMLRVRNVIREFGEERFSKACSQAIINGAPELSHVRNLLINNLEDKIVKLNSLKGPANINPKKNVRGAQYYSHDMKNKGGAE